MHDTNIHVAIVETGGRMGHQLIQAALTLEGVQLGAVLEREGSSLLDSDAGELAGARRTGVTAQSSLDTIEDDFDVSIGFTHPESTLNHLAFCHQHGKGTMIGITGFGEADKQTTRDAAADIAIVFAANLSVGANVIFKLLERTAKMMGNYTGVETVEAHRRYKADASSGTALAMGKVVVHVLDKDLKNYAVYNRGDHTDERVSDTIGSATMYAGDTIDEHTTMFADTGKRLEITHKASSRMTFANGAIRSVLWLSGKESDLLDVRGVLNLNGS